MKHIKIFSLITTSLLLFSGSILPANAAEVPNTETVTVNKVWKNITLRKEADTKSKSLGIIKLGRKVEIVSQKKVNNVKWSEVKAVVNATEKVKKKKKTKTVKVKEVRTGWVKSSQITNFNYYSDYLASKVFGRKIVYINQNNYSQYCGGDEDMVGKMDLEHGFYFVAGCVWTEDPSTIYISEIAKKANDQYTRDAVYYAIAHESAHTVIIRMCGVYNPPITRKRVYEPPIAMNDRAENITDAYAVTIFGASEYSVAYGYNKKDAAAAKSIFYGRCE